MSQPKELLYYREHIQVQAPDGKQTVQEFAGQIVDGGGYPQELDDSVVVLPLPSAVARETCLFVTGAVDYYVFVQDGVRIFVNGTEIQSETRMVAGEAVEGCWIKIAGRSALLLRSDGLRFIGERLAPDQPAAVLA